MAKGSGTRAPRRSDSQWLTLFDEQLASGLTQGAFCARHGLSIGGFGKAKQRLARKALAVKASVKPEFVEVPVTPVVSQHWDLELCVGEGLVVRVRGR